MSTSDTARSLLQFFGTWLEWGQRGSLGVHDASPELMALTMAILDVVPAAWQPYKGRDDGYVNLYQPNPECERYNIGSYDRCLAVHGVPRPPRWVEPDDATVQDSVAIERATVAALVGLAGRARPMTATVIRSTVRGTEIVDISEPGCARVMATLTDEDIAKAEQSSDGEEV